MDPRFQEPANFVWGSFQNEDGAKIRYGHCAPSGPARGRMVMVPGFREPIDKYFETIRDFNARGFEVYIMEWRGQGGSERYLPAEPQKPFSDGFDRDIRDLHRFMTDVVKEDANTKTFLAAHSMGGHIGLRYVREHPETFSALLTTAPMLDIETGIFPKPVARRMVQFAKTGRILQKYMPGGSDWEPGKKKFDENNLTHDPVRWQVQETAMEQKPELRIGDPTYGWLYHAFASIDLLNKEDYLKEIRIPVLMGSALEDTVVDVKAQVRAAGIIPDCTKIDLPGSRHEIWMEADNTRNSWLAAIDRFLDRHMTPDLKAGNDNASKKPDASKKRFAP